MDTVAADAQPVPGVRHRRIPRAPLRVVAGVLAIYLGSRLVQLLFIAWLAAPDGPSLKAHLLIWDGNAFVRIATGGYPHGYSYDQAGTMIGNDLAFFPGYPLLIRGAHATGLDAGWAAIGLSFLAAAVAAVLLFLLGRAIAGARFGYALVALFCTQPMSVVLSMGYSEAPFCAFTAGTLLAAYRRRWLTAGALGFAASLTRPMGLAVAAALAVAAGLALHERRSGADARGDQPAAGRGGFWRPVTATLVALAGVPAYLIWVGVRVGHPAAWFTIQTAGWGTTTDWGRSTVDFVRAALHSGTGWVEVSVALLLIAALIAVVLAVMRGVWLPLAVYGLLAFGLVVGQAGYYHSKPRLLLPVLLTLVPAAHLAARSRTCAAILGLALYAAFGLWYGAYIITVWPYAI